jgi:hypothetical protein
MFCYRYHHSSFWSTRVLLPLLIPHNRLLPTTPEPRRTRMLPLPLPLVLLSLLIPHRRLLPIVLQFRTMPLSASGHRLLVMCRLRLVPPHQGRHACSPRSYNLNPSRCLLPHHVLHLLVQPSCLLGLLVLRRPLVLVLHHLLQSRRVPSTLSPLTTPTCQKMGFQQPIQHLLFLIGMTQ